MEYDKFSKKAIKMMRDKLKMFLFLLNEFETYIKFKKSKDNELTIDKFQKETIDEIITSEYLKNLVIKVGNAKKLHKRNEEDQRFQREKPLSKILFNENDTQLQFYRTYSKSPENDPFSIPRMKILINIGNRSCFGQNSLKSVKLYYKTENEIFYIRDVLLDALRKKVTNKFSSYLKDYAKPKINNKFLLINVRLLTEVGLGDDKRHSSITSSPNKIEKTKNTTNQFLSLNNSPIILKSSSNNKRSSLLTNNEQRNSLAVPILRNFINYDKTKLTNKNIFYDKYLNAKNNFERINIGIDNFMKSLTKAKYQNKIKADRSDKFIVEKDKSQTNSRINTKDYTRNRGSLNGASNLVTSLGSPSLTSNNYQKPMSNTISVNTYGTIDGFGVFSKGRKSVDFKKKEIHVRGGLSCQQFENVKSHKLKLSLNYNYNGLLKIDKHFRKKSNYL